MQAMHPLLVIGVAAGLLGSAPTLLWVSSAAVIFLFRSCSRAPCGCTL
ncbi:hypothetical protein ACTMU2_42125 [Cupriavidus basilensis]